ncbi:MAG: caspase family protein [Bacteroidales bacterium]|nr:caspase family protein [Bacteroidales bacterium]
MMRRILIAGMIIFSGLISAQEIPILRMNIGGHNGIIRGVEVSTDEKTIYTVADDKIINVWNVETGEVTHTFRSIINEDCSGYHFIDLSHNNKLLAASLFSLKGEIHIIDVSSQSIKQTLYGEEQLLTASVRFSANDNFLIAPKGKTIGIWKLVNGRYKAVKTFSVNSQVRSIDISTSDLVALGTEDGSLILLDLQAMQLKAFNNAHEGTILALAFSPDGKQILSGGNDNKIKLWSSDGSLIKVVQEFSYLIGSIEYLDNNTYIAGSYKDLFKGRVSGETPEVLYSHDDDFIYHYTIFPSGKKWISADADDQSLIIGDIVSKKVLQKLGSLGSEKTSIACSRNGIVGFGNQGMMVHYKETNNHGEISEYFNFENLRYITPSTTEAISKNITTTNNIITRVDHQNLLINNSIPLHSENDWIISYFVTSDNMLVVGGIWGLYLYSIQGEYLGYYPFEHTGVIWGIVQLDDNKIATASSDNTIRIWNYHSGELLLTFMGTINQEWICWSPQGYFACSSGGSELFGWQINKTLEEFPEFYPAENLFDEFYRPEIIKEIYNTSSIPERTERQVEEVLQGVPEVEIISPVTNIKTVDKTIEIKIKITDMGGGINEVRVYHNDKVFDVSQRGANVVMEKDRVQNLTYIIPLVSGENHIKITAFNDQRTEAIPKEISIVYEGDKPSSNLYMLIIGINQYKKPQLQLNYALADAMAYKSMIEENSKLLFKTTDIRFIKDEEASRERIIREFNLLQEIVKPEDVFVFYYAGHGVMSESEVPEFYIIPYDVIKLYDPDELAEKAISASELKSFSQKLSAQKQVYLFDACQSGGLSETLASRGAAEERAIAQLARSTGTFWLTATNSDQFASEFKDLGHGLFTYAILQGLNGEADGKNNDRKITVKELSSYLDDKIPELSMKYRGAYQYPNVYGWGMDFPLVLVNK